MLAGRHGRAGRQLRAHGGELKEEAGIDITESGLLSFGCLSEAELHTTHYPNGDVTHCFALLFPAERWAVSPSPTARSQPRADLPTPTIRPTHFSSRPDTRWSC